MADIDMEVDTAHTPTLGGHVDEDLIDYEDDIPAEGKDGQTYEQQHVTQGDGDVGANDAVDTALGASEFQGPREPDALDMGNSVEEPHDDLSTSIPGESALDNLDDGDYLEHGEGEAGNEAEEEVSVPQANDHSEIHEIDFGYGEEEQHHEASLADLESTTGGQEAHLAQDGEQPAGTDETAAIQTENEEQAHTEPVEIGATNDDDGDAPAPVQPHTHDDDEITWEDGNAKDEHETDQVDVAEEAEGGQHDEAGAQGDEPEVHAELETGDDVATADQTPTEPDEPHFPAITVQYKGEEFPLISQTSEGFFNEDSVLDESIEALLSLFRAELLNEIPSEEELVFQVDELGLEYAEVCIVQHICLHFAAPANVWYQSYPRDSLSHVTLRQILEIFDLLVKNQDPDSSRALYTYLFTKPSTTKRFESLVDSAAAGRGLDEVMHLFESPMPHSTHVADTAHVEDGYQELDEYESLDDDDKAEDAQENGEEAEEEEEYADDLDGHGIAHGDPNAEDAGATGKHDWDVDEGEAESSPGEGAAQNLDAAASETVAEGAEVTGEYPCPLTNPWTTGGGAAAILKPGTDELIPGNQVDDGSNEGGLVDTAQQEGHFHVDESLTGEQLAGNDAVNESTVSSTENTAKNDDSTLDALLDTQTQASTDFLGQAGSANGHAEDDAFADIDWQDPSVDDDVVSNSSMGANKRSHANDELDTTDGKGMLTPQRLAGQLADSRRRHQASTLLSHDSPDLTGHDGYDRRLAHFNPLAVWRTAGNVDSTVRRTCLLSGMAHRQCSLADASLGHDGRIRI